MRFGVKTGQGLGSYTYEELTSIWKKSEELGFESAWLHDHFFASTRRVFDPCLEAYTTLAALARDTTRLRFGVMVTCAGYRNPAYLAKIAATIDSISAGRLIMGIGAGWDENEFKSYGYTFPSVIERLGQLKDTLRILRLMWTEEDPSYAGKYYSIQNAACQPKPVQKQLPMWVGINSGTRTLPKMAIEFADGLNTTADPELCRQMIERAEQTRARMGRPRGEVTYSSQRPLLVGSDSEIEEVLQWEAKRSGIPYQEFVKKQKDESAIIGTVEQCAEQLRRFKDAGIEYMIPRIIGDRLLWPLENIKDKLLPLL